MPCRIKKSHDRAYFQNFACAGMVSYFLAISRANKGVDPFGSAVIHEIPKHFCGSNLLSVYAVEYSILKLLWINR